MTDKAIIKGYCKRELCPTAKVIIKRQQTEIERLKAEIKRLQKQLEYCENEGEYWESKYKNAKIEGYKEFADRLKEHLKGNGGLYCVTTMNAKIDNLVKEMVGDDMLEKTADFISRKAYEQVKWERDTAIEQLKSYGVSLFEDADVVEVVRCKDCVFWDVEQTGLDDECVCKMHSVVKVHSRCTNPTDYCSYGERKCEDAGRKYAEGFADGWQGTKEKVRAYNDFLQKKMNIKSD